MSYPRQLMVGLAVLLFMVGMGVGPALADDCVKGCQQLKDEGSVVSAQDMEKCLDNCAKLKELGMEGFSIKCAYELPKVCGAELGWDLLRHCFKPCIEFKKGPCGDCLVKYGFCGKDSQCREWVCKCLMKDSNSCEERFKEACN